MKVSEVLAEMDVFTERAVSGGPVGRDIARKIAAEHKKAQNLTIASLLGIKAMLDERGDSALEFDLDEDALMGSLK